MKNSVETDKAVAMKTAPPATNTTVSVHTEQPLPVPAPEIEEKDLSLNFFVVGGIINITMITAYFIWAFRAWRKINNKGGR